MGLEHWSNTVELPNRGHFGTALGGRFSEVAKVLQVWDFQSVARALSALGSVSVSRSVCWGRFYCSWI